jgi:hypothetical protein
MGRSPSITIGDATEGLRVEHVKSRRLVRLVRWSAGRAQDETVGLEVSDFCARLGITTDVMSPVRRYLLVGDPARPGVGHVVALFATEDDVRAAFVGFRRSERSPGAWAEATEITGGSAMRRICWFGSTQQIRTERGSQNGQTREPGRRSLIDRFAHRAARPR